MPLDLDQLIISGIEPERDTTICSNMGGECFKTAVKAITEGWSFGNNDLSLQTAFCAELKTLITDS